MFANSEQLRQDRQTDKLADKSSPSSPIHPISMYSQYKEYLLKHKKDLSRLIEGKRIYQFTKNTEYILKKQEDLRAANNLYNVDINHFSDMYQSEIDSLFSSERSTTVLSNVSTETTMQGSVPYTRPMNRLQPASRYSNSLNWATSDNPYGRSIVGPVRNQGACGSCWAFVSAGAVAASVQMDMLDTGEDSSHGRDTLALSVQQLIDCDTEYDKGCNGGNPVYAFQYVISNGLTSWDEYPYDEKQLACKRRASRGAVRGYMTLRSSDEVLIREMVDTYGPVAVAVCGGSDSLMFYRSGILDDVSCCVDQTHAVLVVGYGHHSESGVDYWIVQNSWGYGWGEYGFFRVMSSVPITRAGSSSNIYYSKALSSRLSSSVRPSASLLSSALSSPSLSRTGVCGIALSPVVAMGGYPMSAAYDARRSRQDRVQNALNGALDYAYAHWEDLSIILLALVLFASTTALVASLVYDVRRYMSRKWRRGNGGGRIGLKKASVSEAANANERVAILRPVITTQDNSVVV